MFTSVGKAAVRRVQTSRLATPTSISAQLLCRQPALPIRSFTVSTWSSSPTASDKKPAKKTTTTTKKTTGTTTKSKSKATDTKSKDKAKAKPKAAVEKPKKPKKVVDPEKAKKLEIKEVKKWTLKEKLPQLPASSWLLYTFENRPEHLGAGGITQQTSAMAEKFRQLSQSELDVCFCSIFLTL